MAKMDKHAWNAILRFNFYKTLSVLNPMSVKMAIFINFDISINLVAIFKSLSGTVNTCADKCPINCYFCFLS